MAVPYLARCRIACQAYGGHGLASYQEKVDAQTNGPLLFTHLSVGLCIRVSYTYVYDWIRITKIRDEAGANLAVQLSKIKLYFKN